MSINPRIHTFNQPLEIWSKRKATNKELEEQLEENVTPAKAQYVRDKLLATVTTAEEAAIAYLQYEKMEAGQVINTHIIDHLENSAEHKQWRGNVSRQTPAELLKYKKTPSSCDLSQVDKSIKEQGIILPQGQKLFRCALWSGNFKASQPISTTFCPQVAGVNFKFGGKAYDARAMHLWVLTVRAKDVRAFPYSLTQGKLSNELEVLLSSGLNFDETGRDIISQSYTLTKATTTGERVEINVPAEVIFVDII